MAKRNHNYNKRFHNDAKRHEHDSPEDYREHHHDATDTARDSRDYLVDTRDNREYVDDRDRDTGWGWLPLLLIPLFLLGAFLLWPRSNNNTGTNSQTAYVQPTNSYTGNGTTGPATGVGGAPVTSSVTNPPSAQSTANDQVSNTSTNQGPQVGVGGGPGTGTMAQSNSNDTSNTNSNNNNNSVPTTSPRTGHGAY